MMLGQCGINLCVGYLGKHVWGGHPLAVYGTLARMGHERWAVPVNFVSITTLPMVWHAVANDVASF